MHFFGNDRISSQLILLTIILVSAIAIINGSLDGWVTWRYCRLIPNGATISLMGLFILQLIGPLLTAFVTVLLSIQCVALSTWRCAINILLLGVVFHRHRHDS